MPAIADPYRGHSLTGHADSVYLPTARDRAHSLRLRLRSLLHREELTRALAYGADPSESEELALRAARLTSRHSRKALGRALRRTIAEARRPLMSRSSAVIIRRGAVVEAKPEIRALIDRLNDPLQVRARGVAIVERILTDSDRSPLYVDGEPGSLRRAIVLATAALEPAAETRCRAYPPAGATDRARRSPAGVPHPPRDRRGAGADARGRGLSLGRHRRSPRP